MNNLYQLPQLDFEAGAPGATKHTPVVLGQIVVGVIIGIAIAVTNEG
jgi:hypothetical protein